MYKYNNKTYYVPVTPKDTFEIAKRFFAFPLTRAISDRAHLAAAAIHTEADKTIFAKPNPTSGERRRWRELARTVTVREPLDTSIVKS